MADRELGGRSAVQGNRPEMSETGEGLIVIRHDDDRRAVFGPGRDRDNGPEVREPTRP